MEPSPRKLAPIALFVYNRPEHTRKTVEALQKNLLATDSDLFVFADGPKNEAAKAGAADVRTYLKTISGFKSIHIVERAENYGLARSIITGVTEIVNVHGKIIVVEDDLVTSPYFLTYMNDGLDLYEDDDKVASIHGYSYAVKEKLPETFFLRGADCWGWATWKRAWAGFNPDGTALLAQLDKQNLTQAFDLDGAYPFTDMLKGQVAGTNNSWAVRWHASSFLAGKLTLYPGISLVDNIGHDTSGTHSKKTSRYRNAVSDKKISVERIPLEENAEARAAFAAYLKPKKPSMVKRIRIILKIIFNKILNSMTKHQLFPKTSEITIKKRGRVREKFISFLQSSLFSLENKRNSDFSTNGEEVFLEKFAAQYSSKVSEPIIIFDVGANIGEYSDVALRMFKTEEAEVKIHIFEPTSGCLQRLLERFKNRKDAVKINNYGLSDSKNKKLIYYDEKGSSLSSLYRRDLSMSNIHLNKSEEVMLERADEYIEKMGIKKIHLLKLDVEGHERAVLKGLGRYLDSEFIDYIQFEYGGCNVDSQTPLFSLYEMLTQAGFIICKMLPHTLEVFSYKKSADDYMFCNYVAVSKKILKK